MRVRSKTLAITTIVLMLVGLTAVLFCGAASADLWDASMTGGFSDDFQPALPAVDSMIYGDVGEGQRFFAGTTGEGTGCRVYEYSGGTEWNQINNDGFGNPANSSVASLVIYNGGLYAGTKNETTGCEVWRYDDGAWMRVGILGGFGDLNNVETTTLAEYGGNLYAGTENDSSQGGNGCEVWRYTGIIWVQVNSNGFGYQNNRSVTSMVAYNGALVAGTYNTGTGCHVWRYDGNSWDSVSTSGFGNIGNQAASAMMAYDGGSGQRLHVGTLNYGGCQLWEIYGSWGTPTINQVATGGFGDPSNVAVASMAEYDDAGNKLFMGTEKNWANGCEVWTWDGASPAQVGAEGFGDPLNQAALASASGNGVIMFGTLNDPDRGGPDRGTGAEVWMFSGGSNWEQVNLNGFTDSNNYMISSMIEWNNGLYAGTANANGCEIWWHGGEEWTSIGTRGFTDTNNSIASSMAFYDDGLGGGYKLYVGTYNPQGCQVWRFDGPDPDNWTRVSSPADIEGGDNRGASAMVVLPETNRLLVGTYSFSGCEVWEYDGVAPWTKMVGAGAPVGPGFGNPGNQRATAMCETANTVVAGTYNWNNGSEVWTYTTAGGWVISDGSQGGFGDNDNQDVSSLETYGAAVMAGTMNHSEGCSVMRHDMGPGDEWYKVTYDGFGSTSFNESVLAMAGSDTKLYAATGGSCQVWSAFDPTEGEKWTQAAINGFADPFNQDATAMAGRNEGLGRTIYAGTMNETLGASIYSTLTTIDSVSPAAGIQGSTVDITVRGTNTHFTQGQSVLAFDPAGGIAVNSTTVNSPTDISANITISDLAAVGPRVVEVDTPGEDPDTIAVFTVSVPGIATIDSITPPQAAQGSTVTLKVVGDNTHFRQGESELTFSGSGIKVNSTKVTDVHHMSAEVTVSRAAAVGARNVNVVTGNETPVPLRDGFTVAYGPKQAWYLAEGCTANGFETWVLVQNPGPGVANVSLTYMTGSGAVPGPGAELPAGTRKTFKVSDTVPNQTDVSTMVTADNQVIVERSMYGANRGWAHDSIGIWAPARNWYLAEGSTGPGFDTWILVQNPTGQQAAVELTYMTPGGAVEGPKVTMDANTRKSFKVSNTCPGQWEVSTKVHSDRAVVAERSIYGGDNAWATESIGTSQPAETWYLAEGSTGPGFETWVLVQNPGEKEANVKFTFMTPEGDVAGPVVKVPPSSRTTYNIAGTVPGRWSVSTRVESDQPVIAERSMFGNGRIWAHDSIGVTDADDTWCLAEGSTGPGFETWILVQNPNNTEAKVDITYMTPESTRPGPSVVLPPNSRQTFNVAGSVPDVWEVSTKVTSDKPVIAERAVYGSGRVWGHDSIGCPW